MAQDVDNYSGFNATNNTYTVKRDGLYLVHGLVGFSQATGGTRVAGVSINGVTYWGPGYTATTVDGVNCTKTQMFTLFTGDVVRLVCRQDSGSSVTLHSANSRQSRLFMVWLSGPPITGSYGFEDGGSQGWSGTNATVEQSSAWSNSGSGSLHVFAAGFAGQWFVSSLYTDIPVVAGEVISVSAYIYVPAILTNIGMSLDWLDSSGTFIATTSSTTQTTVSNQVILASVNGTVPAASAFVRLNVINLDTSTAQASFYIDDVVWSRWTSAVQYDPPDATFRWVSGTSPDLLPAQFQDHLANDLGFLVHKPYFEAYQNTAQANLAVGAFSTVNLDSVTGIVHSDVSDSYTGATASGFPHYTASVAGWYLVTGEVFTSSSSVVGTTVTAAILAPTSGGRAPSNTPDWFQQLTATSNATVGGGATVFGLYFLLAGETITLQVSGNGYSAPYSTLTGTKNGGQVNSHLEICWCSE